MNESLFVIAIILIALLVEILCAIGYNHWLTAPPLNVMVKFVRWVKIRWYTWRYERADRQVKSRLQRWISAGKQVNHRRKFNDAIVHRSQMFQRLRDVTDAE